MALQDSRTFRLIVSAFGTLGLIAAAVGGLMLISGSQINVAHGSVNLDEPLPPRLSSPAEIAQAALDGQVEALRREGFDQACLMDVEITGERCIERCVPKGVGFYLAVALAPPGEDGTRTCQVFGCACEGEDMILEPGVES